MTALKYNTAKGVFAVTEFEAERERLATLMDFLLEVREARAGGKTDFTADEVENMICQYAEKVKIHK